MSEDVTYTSYNQPRQLFLDSVRDFRKKMGELSFFQDLRAQDFAVEALGQDYLRTEHGEHLDDDAALLEAVLEEYHRRESYMLFGRHGRKYQGGLR